MSTLPARLALLALLAAFVFSCDKEEESPPVVPAAPPAPQMLAVTSTTDSTASLTWYYPSADETGFYLYVRSDGDWSLLHTWPHSDSTTIRRTASGLLPGTDYRFRLSAFNAAGESAFSNEAPGHTTGTLPPLPPVNIRAEVHDSVSVRVAWTPVGTSTGFRIGRREASGSWSEIGLAGPLDTAWIDAETAVITTYYYRVASYRGSLTAWSVDSAVVTTPDGPPAAADSLRAQIATGDGVRLDWTDRSHNEMGFHIARMRSGFGGWTTIDSVAAGVTTYFDHLGVNSGIYIYRVRAFNGSGASPWSSTATVEYHGCTAGAIPLCAGNWWEYHAVMYEPEFDFYYMRHYARDVVQIGGTGYFPWTALREPYTGPEDTLGYLRNAADGCYLLDHPLDGSEPRMYFKYPVTPGEYYIVEGDCVLVTDTLGTYSSGEIYLEYLYDYQRFHSPTHYTAYGVKPRTIGLIWQMEVQDQTLIRDYSLQNYSVRDD